MYHEKIVRYFYDKRLFMDLRFIDSMLLQSDKARLVVI